MQDIPDIQPALSVSQVNEQAKRLLEGHFDQIRVEGEISDFTAASSGHWYFTLKDNQAQIRCAMFRGANSRLRFRPSRGDLVQVRGRISLYTNRGEFQLLAQHMQPAGDGALQLAFEKLKSRLSAEGLFQPEHKQSVPNDARRVGVVTSANGAALHDILSVAQRRSPMTAVFLFPVPVQGSDAPAALVAAIQQANALHADGTLPLDVLIVSRGGGSAEDLWAFNDETLARTIADSSLPVVSAVGHEVDFSICDFVADQRAATPSAAAELITLDQQEWQQRLDDVQRMLGNVVVRHINQAQVTLQHLRSRLRHPGLNVTQQKTQLSAHSRYMKNSIRARITKEQTALKHLCQQLASQHPRQKLVALKEQLSVSDQQLRQRMARKIEGLKHNLALSEQVLRTLGPENTLARGYAVVTGADGNVIRSTTDTHPRAEIRIRLAAGELGADVTEVKPGP